MLIKTLILAIMIWNSNNSLFIYSTHALFSICLREFEYPLILRELEDDALNGSSEACYELGITWIDIRRIYIDRGYAPSHPMLEEACYKASNYWFKRGVSLNNPRCAKALAHYYNNTGNKGAEYKYYAKRAYELHSAQVNPSIHDLRELFECYQEGIGTLPDQVKAKKIYDRYAEACLKEGETPRPFNYDTY